MTSIQMDKYFIDVVLLNTLETQYFKPLILSDENFHFFKFEHCIAYFRHLCKDIFLHFQWLYGGQS